MIFNFRIGNEIKNALPSLRLGLIECEVELVEEHFALWSEIDQEIQTLQSQYKIEDIAKIPVIAASRRAYKTLGKDPARYRLSAEALLRRVLQGKGLYKINNLVDLLNLVSIKYGFSIGGYDTNKLEGDVVLGVGEKREPYKSIGRGELNIAYLPVFRDQIGALGTPTSDSFRTSVDLNTRMFTMAFYDFEKSGDLGMAMEFAKDLLLKYGSARNVQMQIVE